MKKLLICAAVIALASSAVAQDMNVVKSDGITWKEHPIFKGHKPPF